MNTFDAKFLGNCAVCTEPYFKENAVIVHKENEKMTWHVECQKCASSALIAVYTGRAGLVTNITLPSDLTRADLSKIKKSRSINADDVLELHQYLEKKRN